MLDGGDKNRLYLGVLGVFSNNKHVQNHILGHFVMKTYKKKDLALNSTPMFTICLLLHTYVHAHI